MFTGENFVCKAFKSFPTEDWGRYNVLALPSINPHVSVPTAAARPAIGIRLRNLGAAVISGDSAYAFARATSKTGATFASRSTPWVDKGKRRKQKAVANLGNATAFLKLEALMVDNAWSFGLENSHRDLQYGESKVV